VTESTSRRRNPRVRTAETQQGRAASRTHRKGPRHIIGHPVILAGVALLVLGACASKVENSAAISISAVQLAGRIQAGSPPLILDVRTREEYAQGHIPGAINVPHDELPTRLAELHIAKSEEVVVHCRRGGRSRLAEETLRERGYSNVRDLAGHWQGWKAAGLPTE